MPDRPQLRPVRAARPSALPTLVLLAALAVTLWVAWPEIRRRLVDDASLPPGHVYIPSARAPIPAYTRVTLGHLSALALPSEKVPARALRDGNDVAGRVTLVPIPAGSVFTEANLAPRGTRAGLTAGIPEGKVATTLDVSRVEGAVGLLEQGDHVDVIATRKLPLRGGAVGAQTPYESRVIARDAVVIAPVRARQVPGAGSMTSGPRMTNVFELTLAMTADEALAVAEEIEAAKVRFLLLSGRKGAGESRSAGAHEGAIGEAGARSGDAASVDGGQASGVSVPSGSAAARSPAPVPTPPSLAREPPHPVEVISGSRIWTEVPPR